MRIQRAIWRLRRRAQRAASEESGFSLVETVFAMGVMFMALLLLASTAIVGFAGSGLGRQRQTANSLANQVVEQARGLPYETLGLGLSSSDLGSDANIVDCSGTYKFNTCSGEVIVHSPGLPTTPPLVPHVATVGPPTQPSTYTTKTYVTQASGVPVAGAYR